jgi:hypothetical protein
VYILRTLYTDLNSMTHFLGVMFPFYCEIMLLMHSCVAGLVVPDVPPEETDIFEKRSRQEQIRAGRPSLVLLRITYILNL